MQTVIIDHEAVSGFSLAALGLSIKIISWEEKEGENRMPLSSGHLFYIFCNDLL